MKNWKLLMILDEKKIKRCDFAKRMGCSESYLSQIITNRLNVREDEKKKFAAYIGCNVSDIF